MLILDRYAIPTNAIIGCDFSDYHPNLTFLCPCLHCIPVLLPILTFLLSHSSLHFFASTTDAPTVTSISHNFYLCLPVCISPPPTPLFPICVVLHNNFSYYIQFSPRSPYFFSVSPPDFPLILAAASSFILVASSL